jgi:uncharacterized membrane protein
MRLVEWYLGVPPPHAGQGTDWGLAGESLWTSLLPGWALALLIAAIGAGVVSVYVRDARALSWPVRGGLIVLRLASLAVLLIMLARLTLTATRTGMPTLALLIDTSASMGLEDRYAEEAASESAAQLAAAAGGDSATRLTLAQALLTRDEGRFLRRLAQSHRLRLFQFDGAAAPIEVPPADDEQQALANLLDAVAALQPTGSETRPAAAVRQVLDDLRGGPPTALVILTDGIPSTGEEDALSAAVAEARDHSVPLIPIGIGSAEPARDLQLYDVLADDVVFVDDPLTFSFQLKGFGYQGQTARVTLRQQGRQEVLQSVEVAVGRDSQPLPLELTHVPGEAGEFDYIIEVAALPGETNAGNNTAVHRVQVRREQLRVLLVERLPRWEFRHLKPLLERDPAVEVHTVLQQADVSFAEEDLTALPRFPVGREALMGYDVIIWGDVDLSFLSPGVLDHLQEFVAERGGGLVLIAGEGHNPHSYRGTPLEDLLPVHLREADNAERIPGVTPAGFRPQLTIEGRTRAALRLMDSAEQNERLWGRLPPLYWLQTSGRRKPAAQVLAVHPTWHGEGGPLPVIVTQRFGAGQVLFHATDELWQWRRQVEDRYYGRYWLQMVRYLSRSKLRSDARGIELASDRTVYQQGESVELRARFLDPQSLPATDDGARAIVEGPGGRREAVTLTRLREAPNLFTGRISQLTAGSYHAWLAEPPPVTIGAGSQEEGARSPAVASTDFRVEVAASELRDRNFRRADLQEAARGSRGTYYSFQEAERFLDEVPRGRAVPVSSEMLIPLWNRWELLVLLASLLAAEWIIRKRLGLV